MSFDAVALSSRAQEIAPWIVERRRWLHQRPELSYQESETAAFVERELRSLGFDRIEARLDGNWSICAELAGRDPSRCIALRADMDALPIQEDSDLPFRSERDGVAHLCGHDGHTSMLLGAARLLKEREADLPCNVRLFFQGGEERFPGGANDFINAGKLDGVEAIYGLHVHPLLDVGQVQVSPGPRMAGVGEFTITVRGVGGHAAYPHATRDPILAAAHIVTALQQVVARREDPVQPGVLSVTQFHGGSAFNVIPSEVRLNGTYRGFRPDLAAFYSGLIRETAEGVAAAFGCTVEFEFPPGYPPLRNAEARVDLVRTAAGCVFGPENVGEQEQSMGSEDFALFSERVPAAFAWLGVASPGDTDRYMLHHPRFRLDEDALCRGAALLATTALMS